MTLVSIGSVITGADWTRPWLTRASWLRGGAIVIPSAVTRVSDAPPRASSFTWS